jgi:hypothetical protein
MTYQEAIQILKIHQEWRLGANIVMIEPKELTEAIDTILHEHQQMDSILADKYKKNKQHG